MKLYALTSNLQKKLPFINHAISTKSQLPILTHILLEAKNNTLSISSTDLEIGIMTNIKAEIEEEGAITIPAKTFSELILSLPEEKILFQTEDSSFEVISKKTKSKFQTISADEFPKLFEEKGELFATIPVEDLKKGFSSVVFAASIDNTRPALSGVLVKIERGGDNNQGFLLVATDGYRLSLKHHKVNILTNEKDITSMIVPARVFKELMVNREEEGTIKMYISKQNNQIIFEQGETVLIGRLIEAEYPNYERIIPSDHASSVSFDREEMLKAVKICSIFARDAANIVKFSLKENGIVVSASENTVEVEGRLKGEENEIAFNAKYLLDILSNLDNEVMIFEMTGPLNPGVFKIKDDESFLHLIMPIRIQG